MIIRAGKALTHAVLLAKKAVTSLSSTLGTSETNKLIWPKTVKDGTKGTADFLAGYLIFTFQVLALFDK